MVSYPTIFIILDCQNDLLHEDGVFKKHGLTPPNFKFLLNNLIDTMNFCKKINIPIIATLFTVLLDAKGEAMGLGEIKKSHPFLEQEGFREETWGHDLYEGLPAVDFKIRKWRLSPFYETELNHYLSALQAKELILTGFSTNGVVETMAREAISRDYQIITLTDCVTSYSESLHIASLSNLGSFGKILTSKEWQERYTSKTERTIE